MKPPHGLGPAAPAPAAPPPPAAPPEAADPVARAVAAAEAGTSAELVVVIAGRSAAPGELFWPLAALTGLVALAVLAWSPWALAAAWWPLDVAVIAGLGGWLGARAAAAPRLLPRSRRRALCVRAARAAFVEEVAHGTRARTGLLVYASRGEDELVLVPDQGLLAVIPEGRWEALEREGTGQPFDARLLAVLAAAGRACAEALPRAEDDRNELPDAPRRR